MLTRIRALDMLGLTQIGFRKPPVSPRQLHGANRVLKNPAAFYVMLDTKEEIEQRMDELAREYGRTPHGDPRRDEILDELSALRRRLDNQLN
jgi:hypothetical protein